jgi:ABC-type branched-subunit amino acid transport system ATPase component
MLIDLRASGTTILVAEQNANPAVVAADRTYALVRGPSSA